MRVLMNKMYRLTSTGMTMFYSAAPWVIQFTSGGSDQLVSSVIGCSCTLIKPMVKKSALMLKSMDRKASRNQNLEILPAA